MKIQLEIKLLMLIGMLFFNKVYAQNQKVKSILEKSLNAHGGENTVSEIKQIKYLKTTYTYDKEGNIVKKTKQQITHQFDPYETEILSDNKFIKTNGIDIEIIKNGKNINDLESLNSAKGILDGAFYVFWQPMKLKDPGTIIKYLGEIYLPNQKKVHSLQVSYLNGSDTWKFYFDTSSYLLVATEVNHNDRISLIYTTDFNFRTSGVFHFKRESYKLTENRTKLALQASYTYDILDIVKK